MKKINISLSKKSIDNAIKQIREYKQELERKNELFVQRLAEVGYPVVEQYVEAGGTKTLGYTSDGRVEKIVGSDISHTTYIKVDHYATLSTAKLIVQGEEILFIEFGAGVHFNAKPSPHPRGDMLGMTIGSYGLGQGNNDKWVFEKDGMKYITYGTRATMPMYRASLEIRQKIIDIAKEVFA